MNKLPDENIIMQDVSGALVLTTHRVRYDTRVAGQRKVVSITLDAAASCGLITRSYPLLLILGVLLAASGLLVSSGYRAYAFIAGGVLVAAYFLTRSAVLAIGSAAASITVPARGPARSKLVEFVDAVDAAKLAHLRR